MNHRIGPTERLFNGVTRILLFLAAVGITAFAGYYVWVVAFAEPIPDSGGRPTSPPCECAAPLAAPGTPPDTIPADTAPRSAGTPGESE